MAGAILFGVNRTSHFQTLRRSLETRVRFNDVLAQPDEESVVVAVFPEDDRSGWPACCKKRARHLSVP
jgi:hypothetical protein